MLRVSSGVQTPRNRWKHESAVRVLLLFLGVGNPWWNTHTRFWYIITSLAERCSPRDLLLFSKFSLSLYVPLRAVLLLDPKLFLSLVASPRATLSLPLFNNISVADHFAPSSFFVELFSWLIATLRVVLSGSNKLLSHVKEFLCCGVVFKLTGGLSLQIETVFNVM